MPNTIGADKITEIGSEFLQDIVPGIVITNLTQLQVDLILSLQGCIQKLGDSWYVEQIPNSQFGNNRILTKSKLLIGKLRKRFFSSNS